MFKQAAGWLGWPPDVILGANIPHLMLALEGKVDFIKKTNPFGSGEDKPEEPTGGDPAVAAQNMMAFFKRQKQAPAQKGGRK